jgi:hypothetical protein
MMRLIIAIAKPILVVSDLLDAITNTTIKNGPRTEYKISARRRRFAGDSSKSEKKLVVFIDPGYLLSIRLSLLLLIGWN